MPGVFPQHREIGADAVGADLMLNAAAAPPRLAWLDPARGLAILFVLLYHTFGYLNLSSSFHGESGVDAFVLLSGFGLTYGTRAEPWIGFAWRRLKRLLPAYWVALTLCVLDYRAHGIDLGWRQIALHFSCLHLIWGDEYGFGISMSFWFIGLIVPLYVLFALLRPWMLGKHAYSAVGISLALAAAGGMALLRWYPEWGSSSLAHAPHRIPPFFLGVLAGLAYARRDPPDRVAREPVLLLGLAVLAGFTVYFDWSSVPFYGLAGAGIITIGMLVAAAGQRWPIARPVVATASAIGVLAYELYLCHQYLLVNVLHRDLMPRLAAWLPRVDRFDREVILVVIAFATALWVAWALRWLVSFRESKRSWRPTLQTVAALTAMAAIAVGVLARPQRAPRQRTFELAITLPSSPVPACVEPIITFGSRANDVDAVSLQHDGSGLARYRIDHTGTPSIYSEWLPAERLTAGKVNVVISANHLEIRSAAGATLRSDVPPNAAGAYGAVGTNDLQLPGIERIAKSRVVRSADVVRAP